MKKKRNHVGLFIAIAILGVCGIATIFAIGAHVSANTPQPYVWERRHNAARLYAETVELDIHNPENYPQNPQQLMELYNAAFFFLHGDFILDDDIFMEVIEFQRALFTDEILETTTARQQFDNLMNNLEILRADNDVLLRRSFVENIRHDFRDQRTALAYVVHPFMLQADLYRVYHLRMDDNNMWRINSWSRADSEFNILD